MSNTTRHCTLASQTQNFHTPPNALPFSSVETLGTEVTTNNDQGTMKNHRMSMDSIIPLFHMCSPVHLIPHFGKVASPQLRSHSSSELSSSFWLNKYCTKELFHSLFM